MSLMREAYRIYLQSPEWREKREQIFKLRGKKCRACKTDKELHIHHITYSTLGNERPKDLVILCKTCHEQVHKLGGGKKGLKRLLDPNQEKKAKMRQQRKSFVVRMLSGPVKVYTPDEIASLQGTATQNRREP